MSSKRSRRPSSTEGITGQNSGERPTTGLSGSGPSYTTSTPESRRTPVQCGLRLYV